LFGFLVLVFRFVFMITQSHPTINMLAILIDAARARRIDSFHFTSLTSHFFTNRTNTSKITSVFF